MADSPTARQGMACVPMLWPIAAVEAAAHTECRLQPEPSRARV